MNEIDAAYIAGLFDGEGTINIRRRFEKKKKHKDKPGYRMSNSMRISMEIAMTDKNVIELVHETLMVGTVRPKKVPTGMKPQWRWRCTFRDCLAVCKKLWPYAIVKLHKIEQVIDHYEPDIQGLDDNIVDLNHYKFWNKDKNV